MDTINEIEAKQRSERRQLREDAELMNELMAHRGWRRYMMVVEAIAQNYHATVMKPAERVDECVRTEYAKGCLNGLSLATAIPQMKIREAHDARVSVDEE